MYSMYSCLNVCMYLLLDDIFIYWFIDACVYVFVYLCIYCFIDFLISWFLIYVFMYLVLYWLIVLSIYWFVNLLIDLLIQKIITYIYIYTHHVHMITCAWLYECTQVRLQPSGFLWLHTRLHPLVLRFLPKLFSAGRVSLFLGQRHFGCGLKLGYQWTHKILLSFCRSY